MQKKDYFAQPSGLTPGKKTPLPVLDKSKLVKLRTFQESHTLPDGKPIMVSYAIALYDLGVGYDPVLQLSCLSMNFKKKLIAGNVKNVPALAATEYADVQMKLMSIIRHRLSSASLEECKKFRGGSYLQLEGHINK